MFQRVFARYDDAASKGLYQLQSSTRTTQSRYVDIVRSGACGRWLRILGLITWAIFWCRVTGDDLLWISERGTTVKVGASTRPSASLLSHEFVRFEVPFGER